MSFETTPLPSSGSLTADQVRERLTGAALGYALSSNHETLKPIVSPEAKIALLSKWVFAFRSSEATDTLLKMSVDERQLAQDMLDLAA